MCRIRTIDHHPSESGKDSTLKMISDTENWLIWNGVLDNPNESEDDCEAPDQSDIQSGNGNTALESPEHRIVIIAQNVPGLNCPTWRSMKQAEKQLVTVSATETRRNKGNNKK